MIPQSSREFLVKITGYWKPCGGMLAAGNIIHQTRKKCGVPERACDWAHTGNIKKIGCSMGPFMRYLYQWLDKFFFVSNALPAVSAR
uniref:Uncharacterized protein n=1 Tax=Oncorhynchus mykiss TaxID=8022 RepID=A0A8C7V9H5_ONCMY